MKRVFVTGGSGFVGSELIRILVSQGVQVVALARSDASIKKVQEAGSQATVRGDLDSTDEMTKGMQDCDVVFHVAAAVGILGDPQECHSVNVVGTGHVVESAKKSGVPRLVHVSTEALMAGGKPFVDMDETWPYPKKPVGQYAITKGLAEQLVIEANCEQLTTLAVRPPLIWGKGDTTILPAIAAAVKSGQWVWFNGGHYPHTTTHVRNVIEGLLLAAEKGRGGQIYFVTDGPEHDFREFMTALLETCEVTDTAKSMPYWLGNIVARTGEFIWNKLALKGGPPLPRELLYMMGQHMTINDAKAREELGYVGKVSLEEGLAEMRNSS